MNKTPRKANRHFCSLKASFQCGGNFNGKPRRPKCSGCGGAYVVQSGWHGVFIWRGDGRYPAGGAIRVFSTESAADRFCKTDERYVVRWVS